MQAVAIKPNQLFNGSVRFLMPMFQRPYVWDEEQWELLWADVRAVAELVLAAGPHAAVPSHFLGAVVTEQVASFGTQTMTVIDGQQRLTTLQLLIDAAERVVDELGNESDAKDLRALVLNLDENDQVPHGDARFKVWPTNTDRDAFAAAMDDRRPVAEHLAESRLVHAHEFFSGHIREWVLATGPEAAAPRLNALAKTLRTKLTLVGISLEQGDNAQVIFETLNFRGTPLLAADLVKNHLFQRAQDEGRDLDYLHKHYWAEFDGDGSAENYWRTPVRQGRIVRPRLDAFLGHWLVMKLGREVSSDRIFSDFRDHVSPEFPSVETLMEELHAAAKAYRSFMAAPLGSTEEKFRYRVLDALDANAVMPVVLWLVAHEVPADQRGTALESLESWMVRRAVLRLGSKDLTHFAIETVKQLQGGDAAHAGENLREFLMEQTTPARLWPDDDSFAEALRTNPIYRTVKRSVNRMLLEAAEEDIRTDKKSETSQCPRDLSVEHVMPQKWELNWPMADDEPGATDRRNALVQTLGNLTLVTGSVNSSLSNRAWIVGGGKGKRDHLRDSATLKLNADLWDQDSWGEADIGRRGRDLAQRLTRTWPRPQGGTATSSLLLHGHKRPGKAATSSPPMYEIHGPDFQLSGLPRRTVVRAMIQQLHSHGVPMAAIDRVLDSVRLRSVAGTLDGEELFERLVAEQGVNPEHSRRWFLDKPVHEDGRSWVINVNWGRALHRRLEDLAALHEGFGWSTTARLKGTSWSPDDVLDALAQDPDLAAFVQTLSAGIDAIGGRVRGTSASEPSIALGVPGQGGEVWPYTFYAGEPAAPLRLTFNFVARPEGSDERFLARLETILPSLDADALRRNDFKGWPAIARADLLKEGTAEALAAAAEEYLGDGDQRRWWCVHNNELDGPTLVEGGFVSVDWAGIGDLGDIGPDRAAIEKRLREVFPDEKEGAYTNWTGMLARFAFDIRPGDHVIAPVKSSKTVNIGVVTGPYWFDESVPSHQHRLPVEWVATGISRYDLTEDARHEIGGALTLFRVRRTATEFADRIDQSPVRGD